MKKYKNFNNENVKENYIFKFITYLYIYILDREITKLLKNSGEFYFYFTYFIFIVRGTLKQSSLIK